jgi:hypothetical protein
MLNSLRLNSKVLLKHNYKPIFGATMTNSFLYRAVTRSYSHIKDLNHTMHVAAMEEGQRTAKFLEYTTKIYKPSKTITFDRNGEVLLFQCDNFKNSQVYLKYPYCMIDAMIPLAVYIFFCDPCKI